VESAFRYNGSVTLLFRADWKFQSRCDIRIIGQNMSDDSRPSLLRNQLIDIN